MSEQNAETLGHAGVVIETDGKTARVRFVRGKQCEHCGACLTVGEREMELVLDNDVGARAGDRVRVSLPPKRVLQASLLAYAVPLVLLIAGVWIGSMFSEWAALALGVGACFASALLLRLIERKGGLKRRFRPRIEAILDEGEEERTCAQGD